MRINHKRKMKGHQKASELGEINNPFGEKATTGRPHSKSIFTKERKESDTLVLLHIVC